MATKIGRKSAPDPKQVEFELRNRIKELEQEVKTLKNKQEELRKAKNITHIVKQQRDVYVHGKKETITTAEEPKEKTKSKLEGDNFKEERASPQCQHEDIIVALQVKLSDTESINVALNMECEQLKEKLDQVYEELSQKEAAHRQEKEEMKIELQSRWQEMYKEWMKTTETKIRELQQTNDMLKAMLGKPP